MDPRIQKLANIVVNYSCEVKKGEKVLIECVGASAINLTKNLIEEIYLAGGEPYYELKTNGILREILKKSTSDHLKNMVSYDLFKMKEMNAFIGIRASDNINELSDLGAEKMSAYCKHYIEPLNKIRINNTKWVVLRYPNNSMAQLSETSLELFEDFYFKVCSLDYAKMSIAMNNLVDLMANTDKVHIKGPGTDLSFSIKGIPVIKCDGKRNIPDGEVFTAPVKNSVSGRLSYNTPVVFQGFTFENISFEFDRGKIVKAAANDTNRINKVLDTDEGARYIGEFSLGINPHILKPMKDALFDEKIMGSFHFTPGESYKEASNGNDSAIHWDIVCIQTPEYGGGEIYFDEKLIRKDGRFTISELSCLNPENLI